MPGLLPASASMGRCDKGGSRQTQGFMARKRNGWHGRHRRANGRCNVTIRPVCYRGGRNAILTGELVKLVDLI